MKPGQIYAAYVCRLAAARDSRLDTEPNVEPRHTDEHDANHPRNVFRSCSN
jgi:hypothetical protein